MSDDEPIASAALDVAVATEHMLVLAGSLAPIHGAEAVRDALLVAYATRAEHALGHAAMCDELSMKVAAITESPTVADAVSGWLH